MKPHVIDFIKKTSIYILVLGICVMGIVFIFDPFFHYHKPWFGLKAVLADKEYQVVGTLRHFDYDSLIVGSSVSENNDNTWFDEAFDCKSIKAIRSYGATADLCYLLDEAYETHEIKNVFYNLDPPALSADPEPTYELTGCPMYLYDKNPFNDVEYLLNKDVLFKKIPYMIAQSKFGGYEEGKSYNWWQWKSFNSDMALGNYLRELEVAPMLPENNFEEVLNENITLLTAQIKAHPETTFYVYIPPYAMLWWDNMVRTGELRAYIYNMKKASQTLLAYDNVRLYFFPQEWEIVTNLENYMDSLHFSPEINELLVEYLRTGRDELTIDNYEEVFDGMETLVYQMIDEELPKYDDRIRYQLIPGAQ